jgi:hypothetical protein
MTKELTIKEFSEIIQQDYLATTALVKLMVMVGSAKEVGKRTIEGKKGKPSTIYSIEKDFELEFWQDEPEKVENIEIPV